MIFGSLQGLPVANHSERRTRRRTGAFMGRIDLAQCDGIDLQVSRERLPGLMRKIEDHVDIECVEDASCILQPTSYLDTAAVRVVTLHFLQQLVIEALHANR